MKHIEKNLEKVRRRIKIAAEIVNRNPDSIKLVAVTKGFDSSVVREAMRLEIKRIGESRVQEAKKKIEELGQLSRRVEWHMIGHLQSNKAKDAVKIFDFIHSVDRLKIAKKLSKKCLELNKIMPVLIQVNLSGKTYGVKPEELKNFYEEVKEFKGIRVEGLMTIAPLIEPEKTRPYFKKLKELAEELKLKHLSMGMSNDFEVAIQEGATMVRIGTAIFGKR